MNYDFSKILETLTKTSGSKTSDNAQLDLMSLLPSLIQSANTKQNTSAPDISKVLFDIVKEDS